MIDDGKVTYRSRNASDELADFVDETGRYPDGSFGGDPCKIIFGAFETTFRDGKHARGNTSSDNIPVAWIANLPGLARNTSSKGGPFDTIVMTTENNFLQQIDPVDLEPIEIFSYQANDLLLNETGRMAAHGSHSDDGSMYNYVLDISVRPPVYRVFGVEQPDGKARILATIDDAPPAYIHSTFNTQDHIILVVWQADYGAQGKTIMQSIAPWDPERKTLFYVIDRVKGGVVGKYVSEEAFFAFHQINSFVDDGNIMLDLPTMQNYSFLEAANVVSLRQNLGDPGASKHDVPGNFTRYRLPLPKKEEDAKFDNGTLKIQKAEVVFSLPYHSSNIELPRINDKMQGKPYQYAYGIHLEKKGFFADSLIKVDTKTQDIKVWTPETNSLPSEPIFVPSPDPQEEDHGVLLTVAMDSKAKKSALVVVNATTMEEMGRAKMPIVMGYGFHGAWGSEQYNSYY